MHRRAFFSSAAAIGTMPLFTPKARGAGVSSLVITGVEVWRVEGRQEQIRGLNGQGALQPIHIYPENAPAPYRDDPNPESVLSETSRMYLKILTDQGSEGFYGPINNDAVHTIDTRLRSFLIGQDALAIETLWDKMFLQVNGVIGREYGAGMSAVNNTLWDLRGKYFGQPVYKLIGGSRKTVEVYCSTLGYSLELDRVRKVAADLKQQGFIRQKWFPAYGPSHGTWGFEQNVALMRVLRETLGDDAEIMLDPHRGWNLSYALKYLDAVEQYRPAWIEEISIPANIDDFAKLRQMTRVPVATGEQLLGRYEVKNYIDAEAVDIIQCEPDRCGGMSELLKIAALASVYNLIFIPHGGGIRPGFHLVASQSPLVSPFAEFLMLSRIRSTYYEKSPLLPVGGKITIPDLPGFGIEIDESKIEDMSLVS
ncbi:enolase C-terminal domain-like protein [Candidatus Latescibacterota bacterium]